MTLPRTIKFTSSELPINIKAAEQKYDATFVGDFCLRDKTGNWGEQTVAVFWQETPPYPGYSNYFALLVRGSSVYIASGESAVADPIAAIVARNGEIVYSRHRHDYRTSKDGSVTIDGGRDYMRLIGEGSINAKQVQLKVNGPIVEVYEYPDFAG